MISLINLFIEIDEEVVSDAIKKGVKAKTIFDEPDKDDGSSIFNPKKGKGSIFD